MNITQKILAKNAGLTEVKVGQLINVSVNMAMVHDYFAPFCIDKFFEMNFSSVWDSSNVVLVIDHEVPSASENESECFQKMRKFSIEQKIEKIHYSDGVCHQLMVESGYVVPGDVVVGTDSHTCTYGALGLFSTGIGLTEMSAVLGTGKIWLRVPPTIKFEIEGDFPEGVYAKDLILKIIGDIGADGATYKAMEFSGPAIKKMSIDSRLTICNMAVEAGAKNGIIAADKKALDYLSNRIPSGFKPIKSDEDAPYDKIYEYDVSKLEPMVACPHTVDNVKPVREVEGLRIDEAFIGSCTNGRLEDLRIAAKILENRKVSKKTRLIVTPASRRIYLDAIKEGIIDIFLDAGAIITHPSCSLCAGSKSGGIIGDGERVISSTNRNYLARLGSKKSEAYLASPATVAVSAIEGKITECF